MIEEITITTDPESAATRRLLKMRLAAHLGIEESRINDFKIVRKSVDARQKKIKVQLSVIMATDGDTKIPLTFSIKNYPELNKEAPELIIVGAGPAGLFAALRALELGIKPIVIERGDKVENRREKLAQISREGIVDPDTNYCFGEGGAGAYSDGKLFTRSKKRGNVREVLEILHQFGASDDILIESHPHIGSDRLPKIIKNIRETILEKGGEIRFNEKMTDLILENGEVKGIKTAGGESIKGPVVLATGHSSKEIYRLLKNKGIDIEAKGFAIGVRLEHPQKEIDSLRYHTKNGRGDFLPPAEYSFLTRVDNRAVYSFCMCPGGVIVPSMSSPDESVVNGMSASARNGKWANSAMVVEILPEDIPDSKRNELSLLELQEKLEKDFYLGANKTLQAPAQKMTDFIEGKKSDELPASSYPAGLINCRVDQLLPTFISKRLKEGFRQIEQKNRGFISDNATVIGLESRTSSPVRITRDPQTLESVSVKGLYPAGEGAGYAGGIVSSAIDGMRCVEAYHKTLN